MSTDFAFVHAADIHLDSSLSGLARNEETFSAAARNATRRAFANLVDLAIREGARLVVIAGDLYDGTWKDNSTGQFAVAQLARLTREGIRTFIVFGNHDAESRVSRHLQLPALVHKFDSGKCETVRLDDLGVAVHGRSYRLAATTDNLAASYCPPADGLFNLAILHTALEGHEGHLPYAPCTLGQLQAAGHDYWALGHVHERGVRSAHPHVVFPGNLQGRNVRETGSKGATLVRVRQGAIAEVEHHPCDEVRWARIDLDAGQAADAGEVLAALGDDFARTEREAGDRPLAARVRIRAPVSLRRAFLADPDWFAEEVRGRTAMTSESLFLESLRLEASDELKDLAALPELEELIASAKQDPDCARAVLAAIQPLLEKLPAESEEADLAPLVAAARASVGSALLDAALATVEARLAGAQA